MPLIVHSQILRIHAAAVTAGLASNRDALLAGVPHALRTSIPTATSPSAQLLTDLDSLNRVAPVRGEVAPLQTWLLNATALTQERAEFRVFREVANITTIGPVHQDVAAVCPPPLNSTPPNSLSHTAFIEYGPTDKIFARRLETALLTHGISISSLPNPLGALQSDYRDALRQPTHSDNVILVCSEELLNQPDIWAPIDETLNSDTHKESSLHLIPITIDDHIYDDTQLPRPDIARLLRMNLVSDFRGWKASTGKFEEDVARLVAALRSRPKVTSSWQTDLPSREQSDREPAEIFISSAPDDEKYRAELETHLGPLVRTGNCHVWHMGMVVAGQEREAVISAHLETASIVVLLISATYLADPHLAEHARHALDRHHAGDVVMIPVIVRACRWKTEPFSRLMTLPRNGKPVAKLHDRDRAWVDIVEELRSALTAHESAKERAWPSAHASTDGVDTDNGEFRQARRLIKDYLPKILDKRIGNPRSLLARCDIPQRVAGGHTTLEQWKRACKWLSEGGIHGIALTLTIVSKAQTEAFSDEASQWSHQFVQAIVADEDADRGNLHSLLPNLHHFAAEEAQRWIRLCTKIHDMSSNKSNPVRSAAYPANLYAYKCAQIWTEVERALGQHRLDMAERDDEWPEAPPNTEELFAQPRDRTQQHETDLALGASQRQLQPIKAVTQQMLSHGRQGQHHHAGPDDLKKLIIALKQTLIDVADGGYFDEGELDDYVNDLSEFATSLEHQTNDDDVHNDTTKLLNEIRNTVGWIEALVDGRLRNCNQP